MTEPRAIEEELVKAAVEATGLPASVFGLDADVEDELGLRAERRDALVASAAHRLGLDASRARGRTLRELARSLEGEVEKGQLAGKVALVTGSGHGLGKALVRELASLGASVVVNSFHSRARGEETAEELRREGHDAIHLWGSVAHEGHLEALFRAVEERFSVLDIFVNNASNGIIGPLEHTTPEQWERSYKTNVVALHQGALRAARLMTRGGHVASITTPAARKCTPFFGCQGAVKAAVEALIRYLAVELAPRGIRVHALAPGPIYGELLDRYPGSERLVRLWEGLSSQHRLVTEAEVARLIARSFTDPALILSGSVVLADSGVIASMDGYR